MELKRILILYGKSSLNLIILAGLSAAVFLSAGLFGAPVLPVLALAVGVYLGITAAVVRSGRGVRAVLEEKEQEREEHIGEKISEAEAVRNRIAYLRIADGELSRALDTFLYICGRYLDSCRKYHTYSPEANARIQEVPDLLSTYLRELDENAAEKHFGVPNENPFPDVKERILTILGEDKRILQEKIREIGDELDGEDRFRIREDLK